MEENEIEQERINDGRSESEMQLTWLDVWQLARMQNGKMVGVVIVRRGMITTDLTL